jgi:hypothetical protein
LEESDEHVDGIHLSGLHHDQIGPSGWELL